MHRPTCLVATLLCLAALPARADFAPPPDPPPTIDAQSDDKKFTFRVTTEYGGSEEAPPPASTLHKPYGSLFAGAAATGKPLWEVALPFLAAPNCIGVSAGGRYVALLAEYGHAKWGTALVLLGPGGKTITEKKLAELLTPEESKSVLRSMQTERWNDCEGTRFDEAKQQLIVVALLCADFPTKPCTKKELRVELATGAIVRP